MKSRVNMLLRVSASILSDASRSYPAGLKDLARDCVRLPSLVKNRGMHFFLHDLPNLDTMLLHGLESGRLILHGPLSSRVSKKIHLPRFCRGLWSRVFDYAGCLKERPCESSIFLIRQLACIGKKFDVPCSKEAMRKAFNDYTDTDRQLPRPTFKWDEDSLGDDLDGTSVEFLDTMAHDAHPLLDPIFGVNGEDAHDKSQLAADLGTLQQLADDFVGRVGPFFSPCFKHIWESTEDRGCGAKHGPGAVAESGNGIDKFDFPRWPNKLRQSFPPSIWGRGTYVDAGYLSSANHELPSRLLAVPKDGRGPRLIAAEPVEHQWCQQIIRQFLVSRLREFLPSGFIEFTDQETSQRLAAQGSLDRSLSTVDLSSASDRLSCYVVERIFRNNVSVLRALHASRTRWVKIDPKCGYEMDPFVLRKFASQGSATNFPVQTIVFFLIALTVCDGKGLDGKLRQNRGKVRVYGDDIVIPTDRYDRLVALLHHLSLRVNLSKSFTKGNFRESCGGDFYMGTDVTPIKVKQLDASSPTGRQSLIDSSNLFFRKGLWITSETLRMMLPRWVRENLLVSSNPVGSSYLYAFSGTYRSHLHLRWDRKLHNPQVWTYTSFNREDRRDRDGLTRLRAWFLTRPSQDDPYVGDIRVRSKTGDRLGWRPLDTYVFKGFAGIG